MKITHLISSAFLNRLLFCVGGGFALSLVSPVLRADAPPPGYIVYQPGSFTIEGATPFTFNQGNTLTVISPSDYPANTTSVVNLVIVPTLDSNGNTIGDSANAGTYLSFSGPLTFTGPSQRVTVQVIGNFPKLPAGSPVTSINLVVQIFTRLTDWPAALQNSIKNANGVTGANGDGGCAINASISNDSSIPGSSSVTIDSPADPGPVITPTGLPYTLQLAFTTTTTSDALIGSVEANLGSAPFTPFTQPISIEPSTALTRHWTSSLVITADMITAVQGAFTVQARATNALSVIVQDTNQFTIKVAAPPPLLAISSPTNNSVFPLKAGGITLPITFSLTGSLGGGTPTLFAYLDAAVAANAIPFTTTANGFVTTGDSRPGLTFTTGGAHKVIVKGSDSNGAAIDAVSNFTIAAPTPSVTIQPIATPIALPTGSTTVSVPFTFNASTTAGFTVDSVAGTLDGSTPVTFTSTLPALGTAAATVSVGTPLIVGAGTHTLIATVTSAGISASSAVVTFVVGSVAVSPTVVINTPPAGSTYVKSSCGPALGIPLTFTGSTTAIGGITKLSASLDGKTLTVSTGTLGQSSVAGSATMTVSTGGTHTIVVGAKDASGKTASATRTFTVTVVTPRDICGTVFFDTDYDGVFDFNQSCGAYDRDDRDDDRHRSSNYGDFGLPGITVRLLNSANQVVDTDVTDRHGGYCFDNVMPGAYVVSAIGRAGLKATTLSDVSVTVANSDVTAPKIGFGLDFRTIQSLTANCNSVDYWKNNLDKACSGKTSGMQVSNTALANYTKGIGCLGLSVFDGITMKGAFAILKSTSAKPGDLLSKQLLAAEYNYSSGACINGDRDLTFLFLWWGEYVVSNPSRYSSSYTAWATNWFNAYNSCRGGAVAGPSP